jgi:hypothetical protein
MADEPTQPVAPDAQTEQNADLSINDLNAMKAIIDIASSRGAFKPNEMVTIGQTYIKLTNFLDQVQKQAEAQKAAQQPVVPATAGA